MTDFNVRDNRKSGYFTIDTTFIRGGWAAALGAYGIAVYNVLACHADNDSQRSHASLKTIAELIGASRRQVRRSISDLRAGGLIRVTERRRTDGGRSSNLIELIDQAHWLTPETIRNNRASHSTPPDSQSQGGGLTVPGGGDSQSYHELTPLITNPSLKESGEQKTPPAPASPPPPQPTLIPEKTGVDSAPTGQRVGNGSDPIPARPAAVDAYRAGMMLYPPKNTWADIEEVVGDAPANLEFYTQVCSGWRLAGNKPTNAGGTLDWFNQKITSYGDKNAIHNKTARPAKRIDRAAEKRAAEISFGLT